ncbi:putative mitogen-activated protein kinase [Leptomonas pyrrhocoris]|uniref:cyclin-dependent kinase n=1 Tax=Leptomonas pyrrhocoris TaxID=157538 RepID=A0A0N0DZA3_LEPPY|nr:putative mitogen-activated protein kinase [Leptomonas pyrrhocoris]KPA84962.1 putative mitogen-activated protein kinase [Leptomonas pyrrhocoris]|eukprot:XP_015663401.1 putative mitogen-activated protein kinase [Leptomonas pyrrhocoris]
MENYEVLGILGEGTYGVVMKARNRITGKLVAIKRFKQTEEDDHVRKTSKREVRMLQQLRHPNVVRLEEVFRREGKLHLVFEFIDKTILQVLEGTSRGIPSRDLRRYTYQLLRGVDFCHANNIIHRDVKPENVLIDQHGMLKLCDFGFARQMTTKGKYTDYVATRWYRAPELLVGDVSYGKPVDVWAVGCMFAELSDGQPLFPGESDLDQLCLIIQTCGPVPENMVTIFEHNSLYRNVSFPHSGIVYTLQERYHRQSEDWLEFLYACLHPDPAKRLTCGELMALPYFTRDGFRERYEQELRAMSGLPLLLRQNPTASAPSPTRRPMGEKVIKGPKNAQEATTLATSNASTEPTTPPSSKKYPAMNAKGELGKHGGTEAGKPKAGKGDTGSFLPVVTPLALGQSEGSVQLPLIPNSDTDKGVGAAVAAVKTRDADEDGESPSRHRRCRHPRLSSDVTASPGSSLGDCIAPAVPKGRRFSQSFSTVLSSRRTSSASSMPVSPVKKTDSIVMNGATYGESGRRLSNMVGNRDEDEGGRRAPGAAVAACVANPLAGAAAAAAPAKAVLGGAVGGGSKRTSGCSPFSSSNGSPRSSSPPNVPSDAKPSHGGVAPASSAFSPSTTTDAVLKAAPGQQQAQQQAPPSPQQPPHLMPLAERLPDLTSPQLHLATHDWRGSVDMEDIPKPPSQPPCPISPPSPHDGCFAGQPCANPLASPSSQDRGSVKCAPPKTRRSGPIDAGDVPHMCTKKKVMKRRKESVPGHGSCVSSSHSTSPFSPQEQLLEELRARGVHEHALHDGTAQESASVNALKLCTTRASPQLPGSSRSHDRREAGVAVPDKTQAPEKMSRTRGRLSAPHTPGTTTANGKYGIETRGAMPLKERKSKPLHASTHATSQAHEGPTRTSPQPSLQHQQQQLPDTLLALSALRDNTTSPHQPFPHDGGQAEKYPYSRFTQAGGGVAHYAVPPPPKTQTKEVTAVALAKRAIMRSRKPLGVYALQSTRRSLDGSERAGSITHVHDTATTVQSSLSSSQYGGFAIPYHRVSNADSNGGAPQGSSGGPNITPQPPPLASKKARRNCTSISGDMNGVGRGGMPSYPNRCQSDQQQLSPAPALNTATTTTEKPTPRRRENSDSIQKLLPLMCNAATAATTQM